MITCQRCKAIASLDLVFVNHYTEEVTRITIKPCKRCGSTEGDYTDYEELGISSSISSPPAPDEAGHRRNFEAAHGADREAREGRIPDGG